MTNTAELNRLRAAAIAETVIQMGLQHVVLSPGARNTPLVLTLHDLQEAGCPIKLHSVLDERAAAFYALGIARRTDRTVLLSCTSGSAGAHYYPAIVEASEGQVPLMVVTADRPEELQGRGAPQTMPQQDLFGSHVRFSADLGSPSPNQTEEHTIQLVQQAFAASMGAAPGPVHLNAPFRKPLWAANLALPSVQPSEPFVRQAVKPVLSDVDRLLKEAAQHRGVIVLGPDPSARISTPSVCALSKAIGWPILADPAAQARYGETGPIVHQYDVLLRSERVREQLAPSMAITLGGTTSSKPLSMLLSQIRTVHIGGSGRLQDPWQSVEWTLQADIETVAKTLDGFTTTPQPNDWVESWLRANDIAAKAIQQRCCEQLWEGSIAHTLVESLSENTLLRLASSMPIRDVDSFAVKPKASLTVSSNRGVNGIDGLIATSIGEAHAHPNPTVILSGDLSFIHDIGALATVPKPQTPVVFVVVDNGGGGIFGFLPMSEHPTGFERWFVTPHKQNIPKICRGFGLDVDEINNIEDFKAILTTRTNQAGIHVIHIPIDRVESTQQHTECFQDIVQIIEDLL